MVCTRADIALRFVVRSVVARMRARRSEAEVARGNEIAFWERCLNSALIQIEEDLKSAPDASILTAGDLSLRLAARAVINDMRRKYAGTKCGPVSEWHDVLMAALDEVYGSRSIRTFENLSLPVP